MQSIKDIIANKKRNPAKLAHNKYEFQAYGNMLADELSDMQHRSLYIKLAKSTDRKHLELARETAKSAQLKSGSRAKIFMWKLKTLKDGILK